MCIASFREMVLQDKRHDPIAATKDENFSSLVPSPDALAPIFTVNTAQREAVSIYCAEDFDWAVLTAYCIM